MVKAMARQRMGEHQAGDLMAVSAKSERLPQLIG
jgi:hypothetical protein